MIKAASKAGQSDSGILQRVSTVRIMCDVTDAWRVVTRASSGVPRRQSHRSSGLATLPSV